MIFCSDQPTFNLKYLFFHIFQTLFVAVLRLKPFFNHHFLYLILLEIVNIILAPGKQTRPIYDSEYPVIDQNFYSETFVNIISLEILHSALIEEAEIVDMWNNRLKCLIQVHVFFIFSFRSCHNVTGARMYKCTFYGWGQIFIFSSPVWWSVDISAKIKPCRFVQQMIVLR